MRKLMMAAAGLAAIAGSQALAAELPICKATDLVVTGGWLHSEGAVTQQSANAGEEAEAELGQPIISSIRAKQYAPTILLNTPLAYAGDREVEEVDVKIPAGRLHPINTGEIFNSYSTERATVTDRKSGKVLDATVSLIVKFNGDPARLMWQRGRRFFADNIPDPDITKNVCLDTSKDSFRQEIVYTGSSKGTVTLLYREFSGDLVRPAFTQTLTYDLSAGDEIGYKGARLKVLRADNVSLRVKVLKPLNGE